MESQTRRNSNSNLGNKDGASCIIIINFTVIISFEGGGGETYTSLAFLVSMIQTPLINILTRFEQSSICGRAEKK